MKLRFDADLPYQRDAIDATLAVFDGQPLAESQRSLRLNAPAGDLFSELWVLNHLAIDDKRLAENIQRV